MVWEHNGEAIPLEVYHGVPAGWRAAEIVDTHLRLGGTYDISGADVSEPGAPGWLPDRYQWLQYRETMYRVSDGVRARDEACVELAIRYIEMRYIGSYSGYIRARLSRALKNAPLTGEQRQRLKGHFYKLLRSGEHTVDFREYFKLWRRILTEEEKTELLKEFGARKLGTRLWLERNLQPDKRMQSGVTEPSC